MNSVKFGSADTVFSRLATFEDDTEYINFMKASQILKNRLLNDNNEDAFKLGYRLLLFLKRLKFPEFPDHPLKDLKMWSKLIRKNIIRKLEQEIEKDIPQFIINKVNDVTEPCSSSHAPTFVSKKIKHM